jgi:hypothetical protein
LRKIASDAGRDPMSVGLAYRCSNFGEGVPMKASDGDRRLFSGGPAEIAGDLRDFRALGVAHVDFGFGGASADETLSAMQRFRNEVVERL